MWEILFSSDVENLPVRVNYQSKLERHKTKALLKKEAGRGTWLRETIPVQESTWMPVSILLSKERGKQLQEWLPNSRHFSDSFAWGRGGGGVSFGEDGLFPFLWGMLSWVYWINRGKSWKQSSTAFVSDYGVVLKMPGKCWLSEYCWLGNQSSFLGILFANRETCLHELAWILTVEFWDLVWKLCLEGFQYVPYRLLEWGLQLDFFSLSSTFYCWRILKCSQLLKRLGKSITTKGCWT